MDGEQGTAQGNDGHWDFCRASVCDCVEEGRAGNRRAGDRTGECKVRAIPGRKDGPI